MKNHSARFSMHEVDGKPVVRINQLHQNQDGSLSGDYIILQVRDVAEGQELGGRISAILADRNAVSGIHSSVPDGGTINAYKP